MCSLVNRTKVVVFMRGTERKPDTQCKDSQEVVSILEGCKIFWDAVNILKDTNAELAIREYTEDNRMPLIFLKGELLGSVAELREANQSGQLEEKLKLINVKRRKT